jgi:UPF0716 protein FxsA
VVLSGVLGLAILRRQGGELLARMRGTLQSRRDPRPLLLRGGFRFVAALLLLLPGFLSDLLALALLLPPVQGAIARGFARRGIRIVEARGGGFGDPPRPARPQDRIAEAEWEEVAPPTRPTHPPSGWTRH